MIPRVAKGERALSFRIGIVGLFFAILVCAILFRAYELHINTNPRLKKWAKKEYEKYVVLSPQRGDIFDRKGRSLASSINVKSLYVNPKKINDKLSVARKLSKITGQKSSRILKKLKSNKHFVWIKRKVSPNVYKKVKGLSIKGIGALTESKRFYPNTELAAGVLGFTGVDSNGLSGIELEYDEYLRSEESRFKRLSDALGRELFTEGFFVKEYSKGNDIYLTLDRTVQYISEIHLDNAMAKSGAKKGYIIAMEPKTGKILSLVSRPKFNPNNYRKFEPSHWTNGALSLVFEPGSTFKVFVTAAALEEVLINPDDVFYCQKGSFTVAGKTIRDSSDRGWLIPSAIIKRSSNIGAAKIALLMGREKLYKWAKAWGFGEFTGIDLPGETRGLLRHFSKWRELDLATAGFGQGIAVSAIQLTSALSSIANGGMKVRPFIVDRIVDPEGKVILKHEPQIGPRIISQDTSETIRNFMIGVTDPDGTGHRARIEGFTVAGKTGTAQKVDSSTGEYSKEKIVVSFMGFVPADDPKIAILVVIDEPKGKVFGGGIAAPVFRDIARETLSYMHVLPPLDIEQKLAETEPLESDKEVKKDFILVSGDPSVEQFDGDRMPNFEGMSIREVFRMGQKKGITLSIKGTGLAFKQTPNPGVKLAKNKKCTVYFRPI